MDNRNAESQINRRKVEAEVILDDEEMSNDFINKAEEKAKKAAGKNISTKKMTVRDFVSYISLFTSLVRSYVRKEYKEIPIGTIVAVVATLLYFVSPIDILPDFIPGIGYIDDAAVVAFSFMNLKSDLDRFRRWKESRPVEEEQ